MKKKEKELKDTFYKGKKIELDNLEKHLISNLLSKNKKRVVTHQRSESPEAEESQQEESSPPRRKERSRDARPRSSTPPRRDRRPSTAHKVPPQDASYGSESDYEYDDPEPPKRSLL